MGTDINDDLLKQLSYVHDAVTMFTMQSHGHWVFEGHFESQVSVFYTMLISSKLSLSQSYFCMWSLGHRPFSGEVTWSWWVVIGYNYNCDLIQSSMYVVNGGDHSWKTWA